MAFGELNTVYFTNHTGKKIRVYFLLFIYLFIAVKVSSVCTCHRAVKYSRCSYAESEYGGKTVNSN